MSKDLNHIISSMKNVDIFASMDDDSMRLICENFHMVTFKATELICNEGDPGTGMYVVESGEIEVLKKGNAQTHIEVATLGQGEVAGIMSLFGNDTRSATMKAKTDVELWEMRDTDFRKILNENPAIATSLLQILSGYLRQNIQVIADLRTKDVDHRLKIAMFDSKPYTERTFIQQNNDKYALKFFEFRLTPDTVSMAMGFKVVCCFVNDTLNAEVIRQLNEMGVEKIAMRCAGYNNVDLEACKEYGISVTNVPQYSPYAVAEHAVALIMSLNRHVNRAYTRVRDSNFALEGLVGFDMYGKTAGIIGAGRIGQCAINILSGFGCKVLVYNRTPKEDDRPNVRYVSLEEVISQSDIISLHAPLVPKTKHLINDETIDMMKPGVMIINTGRGALVDTRALIRGLVSGKIGAAGLDVYEEEGGYFFEDHSNAVLKDEILARLVTFNNVIITPHMAFLTEDALLNIADVTLENIEEYENGKGPAELSNSLIKEL